MENWFGFRCEEFLFEGRNALIVFPETPDADRNWTLKTEYRDAFPEAEIELLRRGFHFAFLTNLTRFATKEDCDAKARFVQYLHDTYGLRDKCVPVGMSCGGAHAMRFAGLHPECVACMFIDAPVLNYLSFPGKLGIPLFEKIWETEFQKAYPGVSRADLLNFKEHPMNQIPALKAARIPIVMAYGTEDMTVPYDENGKLMEMAYADAPELLTLMVRQSQGHHPHGFPTEPWRIADYIVSHC